MQLNTVYSLLYQLYTCIRNSEYMYSDMLAHCASTDKILHCSLFRTSKSHRLSM